MKTAPTSCFALLVILATLLTACDFHLRGVQTLPPGLERPYVHNSNAASGVAPELANLLRTAGAQLVRADKEATAVIRITKDKFDLRVLAVDNDGRALELALHYEVGLTVVDSANKALIAPISFRLVREYLNDESNVLATAQQTGELRDEMERDAAQQAMRRLNAQLR